MHISEGALAAPVLATGGVLALAGLAVGLKSIKNEELPQAAMLAAVFFTASLIHVPIGPASTHLVLSGLIGLLMGWAAFPVIFVGLLLQGILFQFGGLSTLGVNTFNMAAPAVALGFLVRPWVSGPEPRMGQCAAEKINRSPENGSGPPPTSPKLASVGALVCGGGSILVSALLVALCLALSETQFKVAAYAQVVGNLPVAGIEALVTMFCVQFLRKVRPGFLKRRGSHQDTSEVL